MLGFELVGRTQRTGFSHAPGMNGVAVILLFKGFQHRWRAGRATDHIAVHAFQRAARLFGCGQ